MKKLALTIVQWTWGFFQNVAGFFTFMAHTEYEQYFYEHALVTRWERSDAISLGMFIFVSKGAVDSERLIRHEYGHSLQSVILGPLYLLIIGLPSYIWANCESAGKKWRSGECSYFDYWTGRWADRLGGVKRNSR